MKLTTAQEMRAVEEEAARYGLTSEILMETAGAAIAQAVLGRIQSRPGRVLVVAGPGQNGGDGLTAARHLLGRGCAVHVWLLADEHRLRGAALGQFRRLSASPEVTWSAPGETPQGRFDAAIDAIFGTSLRGDVDGDALRAVHYLAAGTPCVVAADLPSGVVADSGAIAGAAVRADCTVALGALKPGHVFWPGAGLCGEIVFEPLGLLPQWLAPLPVELVESPPPAPDMPPTAAKQAFGRTIVVAGSGRYPGAAWLAARAAVRGGSGLTVLASVSPVLAHAGALAEVIQRELPAGADGSIDPGRIGPQDVQDATAVALGPGLGAMDERARDRWLELILALRRPLLLDADGLRAVQLRLSALRGRSAPTVLTPHAGEAGRLLGRPVGDDAPARLLAAREIAAASGAVVLLKGHPTFVASPTGRVGVVAEGGPELAVGGTGDVLSGLLAAQMARGMSARSAAERAALLHARAGGLLRRRGARGGLASELADLLPLAAEEAKGLA